MTRRERFRQYMTRVAAAADPALALMQNLYVHPPNAISDVIVRNLEIEPTSRHLVVGSIGSGKTTQLLMANMELNDHHDLHAAYVDVSQKQDLVKLTPGCLVALAGLALLEGQPLIDEDERRSFTKWANGYWLHPEEFDEPDDRGVQVEGAVTPPQSEWHAISAMQVDRLAHFAEIERYAGRQFVVLFDSLDRTTNRSAFTQLIDQDVAALRRCHIGVVLIGPIRSLEGFGRLDVDRFDKLHVQGPVDVEQDPEGRDFLFRVLRARVEASMLPDREALALVAASGGVLRDLISLSKAAGDEAYLSGSEAIEMSHVQAAADAFGRSLMIGLHKPEIDTLKHLRSSGGFVWTTDEDLALLATRRVLEYPHRTPPFSVHPTIGPLLDQKAG
jgi:energy-coupling factor transporter ATP-binding protein EcfA2